VGNEFDVPVFSIRAIDARLGMCRIAKADFEAGPMASSAARAWVTTLMDRWGVSHVTETAILLTSELVTNALRHGESAPAITAAIAAGFLEVGVTDTMPEAAPQVVATDDPTVVGGRGMAIVEALSVEWGTAVLPEGKQVWFRLEVTDWAYLSACRCIGDAANKVVLNSGRNVLANSGPWDVVD
jgi:anti-sigma regulatory factor (Ser/Thr protein kinase)